MLIPPRSVLKASMPFTFWHYETLWRLHSILTSTTVHSILFLNRYIFNTIMAKWFRDIDNEANESAVPVLSSLLCFLRLHNTLRCKVICLWKQWIRIVKHIVQKPHCRQQDNTTVHAACSINHPDVRTRSQEVGKETFWPQGISPAVSLSKAMKIRNCHQTLCKEESGKSGLNALKYNHNARRNILQKQSKFWATAYLLPQHNSEHSQLMGKSATMTLCVDKVVCFSVSVWDYSSESIALPGPVSFVPVY